MSEQMQGVVTLEEAAAVAHRFAQLSQAHDFIRKQSNAIAIHLGNGEWEKANRAFTDLALAIGVSDERLISLAQDVQDAYRYKPGGSDDDQDGGDDVQLPDDDPPVVGKRYGAFGNLTRYDTSVWQKREIAPGLFQEGDLFRIMAGAELSDLDLVGTERMCLGHWNSLGDLRDRLLSNCRISAKTWGERTYSLTENNRFVNCTFEDIEQEHGHYPNVKGTGSDEGVCIEWAWCLFQNIAAQAIQVVSADGRAERGEQPASDNIPGGKLWLHDSLVRRVSVAEKGVGGGRSFPLSFFPAKHPVVIERVKLNQSMMHETFGALLVQGPKNGEPYKRTLRVEDFDVDLPSPNREVFKLEGLHGVRLRHVKLNAHGSSRPIAINSCDDVLIEDCEGDTPIMVDGKVHGPLSGGFEG